MTGLFILALFAPPDENHRDALARYGAAVLKQSRDELVSAQRQYESAAKGDPTAAAPLRALIPVYLDLGRDPAAERAARKVLEIDPDDAATGLVLGKLLHSAKKPTDAAVVLTRAAESPRLAADYATSLDVWHELARAAEGAGDFTAAESALKRRADLLRTRRTLVSRSLGIPPEDVDHLLAKTDERLGTVRLARKDWTGAEAAFRSAAALYADPKGANDAGGAARVHRNRARTAAAKGDPATAAKHQAAYLAAKPPGLTPITEYARYLRDADRDAVVALTELSEAQPRNERVKWVLAAERGRAGFAHVAPAREALTQFAAGSTDPELFDLVAAFLHDTGRPEDAWHWADGLFQSAKDAPPDSAKRKRTALVADAIAGNRSLAESFVRHAPTQIRSTTTWSEGTWDFVAWLAERSGLTDDAADAALAAFRAAPKPGPELTWYAYRTLARRHQWEEVVRLCDRLAVGADLGDQYRAYTMKATACAELGRERDALNALARISPENFAVKWKHDLRLRRVEVLGRVGAYDRAAAEGEKLLAEQSTPGDAARVRYALSTVYLGLKQIAKSEDLLRSVLEYDPDDVLALNNLGYHLADEGRKLPEAESLIRRAIELNRDERARAGNPVPENGVYLDSLGWVLFRRGKLAEAQEVFERAVTFPDGAADPVVWDHYGDVLFKRGEKEKAQAAWKKAEPGYATGSKGRDGGRKEELQRKLALVP